MEPLRPVTKTLVATLDGEKHRIVGAKELALPKYLIKYTPHGEVLVHNTPEGMREDPLRTVQLMPVPDHIEVKHRRVMGRFYRLLQVMLVGDPNRLVPLTWDDCKRHGLNKRLLKDLVEVQLLKECLIPLGDRSTGESLDQSAYCI